MDIFINGKQGAGKSRLTEKIVKAQGFSDIDVLYMHDLCDFSDRVRLLVETIRAARVRAVVFDGCISNGADLLVCVQAVKEYRAQINADILAVYVQQAEVTSAKDVAENMPQLLTHASCLSEEDREDFGAFVHDVIGRPILTKDEDNDAARNVGNYEKAFPLFGIVVFYQIIGNPRGLREIRRTPTLPYSEALDVYANTPNPASQLVKFSNDAEREEVLAQLAKDIVDPEWLNELFNCI